MKTIEISNGQIESIKTRNDGLKLVKCELEYDYIKQCKDGELYGFFSCPFCYTALSKEGIPIQKAKRTVHKFHLNDQTYEAQKKCCVPCRIPKWFRDPEDERYIWSASYLNACDVPEITAKKGAKTEMKLRKTKTSTLESQKKYYQKKKLEKSDN